MVPDAIDEDGTNNRISVSRTTTFEELLGIIHDSIGCANVNAKLQLKYHLTDISEPTMKLETADDFQGLLEEIISAQRKKKDGSVVKIQTIISDNVSRYTHVFSIYHLKSILSTVHYTLGKNTRGKAKREVSNWEKGPILS